ncbi:FAD-binding oxidoreductase [Streptomyces flavalbus]|uniref:FAD-binding oxidoreductase n=1 Tax=Streptomyces flavalbus TaxID=2665155 RepID=A0ABW2W940_9ACTN
MERRTFVGGTAAAVVTASTSCSPTPHPTPETTPHPAPPRTPIATPRSPAPTTWSALAENLDGPLIRPADQDWPTARQLYNTRFDTLTPAAVVYADHAEDIRTALSYARAHDLRVAIRGGGHSYAGWSSGNGRLVIDVSQLDDVRASGTTAVVGAGAKLIDVYRALAATGATIPAGSCPTVGISGLTLGGGHGVVSRAYGLTCDSLTRATLVTADGEQLTADATEHPDLFWALRGAGNGTFGVVTELHFRTHPAPQGVSAYLSWPWSRAAAVLGAWQEWGPDQPDEIWSAVNLNNTEGGSPTVSVTAFSLGTYGELQNAVDRLADRIGASAANVVLKRRSYRESMEVYAGCASFGSDAECHLPGSTPGRSPEGALARETYAARSDFFDRAIPAEGVQTLLARITAARGGKGSVALTALGGAVNRVSPTATAFVHRGSRMLAQYIAAWQPGTSGTAAQTWLSEAHTAMRPYASGSAYQNYTDPTLENWREAYYGEAAPRLTKLKRTYDPTGFFTHPQSL